jgi:C-terminal processing protease CtpA/Prc
MQRRQLASFAVGLIALLLGMGAEAAGKGWFGVVVHVDASGADATPTSIVSAVTVEQVVPGSPAAKAGIVVGDSIVEIGGVTVAGSTLATLQTGLQKSVGETLRLKIRHAGNDREVSLVAVQGI